MSDPVRHWPTLSRQAQGPLTVGAASEEVPGSRQGYRFSHALVQETLSEELPTRNKVRLHGRIGAALETLYGADVLLHADELAYHFGEAEPILGAEKLVYYSLLAGEQALVSFAYEEALAYFQRALAAKEGPAKSSGRAGDAETALLLFGLGRAQAATLPRHRHHEAVASLSRALDYYAEVGEISSAVAVAECPIPVVLGQRTGAAQLLVRALALVPADSQEAGRLLYHYGNLLTRQEGDYQGGQEAFNRALAIAQREEDAALEMRILANSSQADIASDNWEEGGEKSRRAVELAGRVDDPHSEVIAHWQVLEFLVRKHDLEGARLEGAAMLATAERLRNRDLLNTSLYQNANLARGVGDWSTARSYCDRVLEVEPADPRLLAVRAIVGYETGDFDQGEADLESLVQVMRLTPPSPSMGQGFLAALIPRIAQITGVLDRLDIAKVAAKAILASSSATRNMRIGAQGGLAFQVLLRGNTVEAQVQYIALESRRGTIFFFSQIAADRLLGLLCVTQGKLEAAMTHFEDAVALCRDAGYHPELAWTCHDYADALLHPSTSSSPTNSGI